MNQATTLSTTEQGVLGGSGCSLCGSVLSANDVVTRL